MENNVKMVPAICTQCGGRVEVDKTKAEVTLEWKYQDFDSYGVSLSSEDSNINSYYSCVVSSNIFDEGVGYVVTAGFDRMTMASDPSYYCVVRVYIEDYQIVDADEPVIVEDLSEYNYD